MLKPIACGAALWLAAFGAQAQEMRQFFAETATPMAEITAHLRPVLPETVALTESADTTFISYNGTHTPPGLQAFLVSAFETLDPSVLQQTVALSLVMNGQSGRTDLTLMVRGRFPERATPILPGGLVVMDGRGTEPCSGQLIVQHALTPEATLHAYQNAFEADGFLFEEPHEEDTSFFIGSQPGCAVALYVQGEAGGSTAVIRYLEE